MSKCAQERQPPARMLLSTARFVWEHPENADHRPRAMARFVGWQAWQRIVRRPWTITIAGDVRLKCYPHSTAAAAVLYSRLPEWEDMRFVLDFLQPGDAFVDVGSNIGAYTILAASVEGVEVAAFEPSSTNRIRLEENVRLNGMEGRVSVHAEAVSDTSGTAAFTTGLDTVNHLLDPAEAGANATELVRTVTLDQALPPDTRHKVSLVKIDVEGAEALVLAGAEALIAACSPAFIVERNDPPALADFFADHGYVTCRYDPTTRRLEPCAVQDHTGNNILAVADLAAASAVLSRQAGRAAKR